MKTACTSLIRYYTIKKKVDINFGGGGGGGWAKVDKGGGGGVKNARFWLTSIKYVP